VELYDRGQDAHNLNIVRLDSRGRPVGSVQGAGLAESGGLTQATWHVGPGRYLLYCSLPEHEKRGMRAYLVVR
jgi:plastocyanin